jgi:hypothetical protein
VFIKSILIFIFFYFLSIKKIDHTYFHLGENYCLINIIKKNNKSNFPLIALHEDENTCISSFQSLPNSSQFYLIQLKQKGKRLLEFKKNKITYIFDPNRIFTKPGIKNTLSLYNKSYSAEIFNKIHLFADSILRVILPQNKSDHIIAIHNNTDNKYSILSYQESTNTKQLYINPKKDSDDFFLVTERNDFDFFKQNNYNVILQSKEAIDDGSLSVYCQNKNIPYINIEAQIGHQEEQIKMLKLCEELLNIRNN